MPEAPINEAVFLLNELDPDRLATLRVTFAGLDSELKLGRMGGVHLGLAPDLNLDRAEVMLEALVAARSRAEADLVEIRSLIRTLRKRRLWCQIGTVVATSGVLASLQLDAGVMKYVSAALGTLALLASVGSLISDHQERLTTSGAGNIYDAFEQTTQIVHKAGLAESQIRLLIKHSAMSELIAAIEQANLLCEQLAQWIMRLSLAVRR